MGGERAAAVLVAGLCASGVACSGRAPRHAASGHAVASVPSTGAPRLEDAGTARRDEASIAPASPQPQAPDPAVREALRVRLTNEGTFYAVLPLYGQDRCVRLTVLPGRWHPHAKVDPNAPFPGLLRVYDSTWNARGHVRFRLADEVSFDAIWVYYPVARDAAGHQFEHPQTSWPPVVVGDGSLHCAEATSIGGTPAAPTLNGAPWFASESECAAQLRPAARAPRHEAGVREGGCWDALAREFELRFEPVEARKRRLGGGS